MRVTNIKYLFIIYVRVEVQPQSFQSKMQKFKPWMKVDQVWIKHNQTLNNWKMNSFVAK